MWPFSICKIFHLFVYIGKECSGETKVLMGLQVISCARENAFDVFSRPRQVLSGESEQRFVHACVRFDLCHP